MELQKNQFPSILKENEIAYFKYLEAVINSVDLYASVEATCKPDGYLIRLAPSDPQYLSHLLQVIKVCHRQLGIEVEFSKSIKTSTTITFLIINNK